MLLIEMQCKDWEHNRVNAGIIELCSRAFPKEKIKLYAEEAHIRELKILTAKQDIEISAYEIDFADWRFKNVKYSDKYVELLTDIIERETEEKKIILLSCNKGIIKAVACVSTKYSERNFYVILHAALEEAVHQYHPSIRKRVRTSLLKMKNALFGRKTEYRREPSIKKYINECTSCNCYFILYAPKYREYLEEKINHEILGRFIFLHHPLYESSDYSVSNNDSLTVGIYGQAVNQNAYDIVNIYNKKYDNGKVMFRVMAKQDNPILCLKNVTRMFERDYVSNRELEQERKRLDYILLPYDHNQYKVTASGILCDALSEEIPVLMLDSSLLEFYNTYAIGELRYDVDSMARTIADIAADTVKRVSVMEQYRKAENRLKKQVLQDNIKTFRETIG